MLGILTLLSIRFGTNTFLTPPYLHLDHHVPPPPTHLRLKAAALSLALPVDAALANCILSVSHHHSPIDSWLLRSCPLCAS